MDRIAERLAEVARSGRYILGPEVEAFESEFAGYCGARHCIGVANGTDAISISLRALGGFLPAHWQFGLPQARQSSTYGGI